MKRLQRAFCAVWLLLLVTISSLYAQNSNIGTEFWTGYMAHVNGVGGSAGSQMNLYFASDVSTTVTVSSAGSDFAPITATVVPNTITTVAVPTAAFLGNTNGSALKGIHIVSQNPVAVYAHIYASSVSGATLLLPVNTLTNDYFSLNYTQVSNASAANPAYSTFMVVATADSTTIQITPSAKLLDNSPAGTPFLVTLQKGELYQGVSTTDLTGTHIMSVSTGTQGCKKIAVFSGSSKIKIGSPNATSDNLFQQVYPTAAWGKNYITVPLKSRNYDVYRIAVSDPSTIVKINGAAINATLINNFYYEFSSQATNYITADKPIQVVQYAVTQSNTINGTNLAGDVGDPEMIYLNPLEQNIDHVTLYSAHEYLILKSFINVVIPTSATSSFLLDGSAPVTPFTPVTGNTAYSYGQFAVSNATHVISANQGFNAIAYGFGNAESYGYAAGTNVKNLNEFVQLVNPATNTVAATGCTNSTYNPEVALPYKPLSITWDLGNNTTPTTQPNPTYKRTVRQNDTTLYIYDYGTPVVYPAGTYAIKVTVIDPISTLCGSTEEISLSYTVVEPPGAKFSSRDTVCTQDTVGFHDQTSGGIKSWHWNFGGGVSDTSNLQNPVHVFLQSGSHLVTLSVTGSSGCTTTATKIIYSRVLPVAGFVAQPPVCESPLAVMFKDTSVPSEGNVVAWVWDFGDRGTSTLQNPLHQFAAAGTYPVSLIVVTDKGCSSSISKNVTVNYTPKVSFNLPDVCEYDTFTHFTAITSIADSTSDPLTYSWNFGDPTNSTNPNTATGKTVQHHFKGIGKYNVTLTVTSAYGCVKDTMQTIQVNGGNPKAAYKVIGGNKICSNIDAVFRNDAYVEGGFEEGKITSFKFNFGDGSPVQTLRVDSGKTFTHTYPKAYTAQQPYITSMVAYSGETCFSTPVYDTIYLEPVPKTKFDAPAQVCQNGNALQLANYVTQTYAAAPAGKPFFYIDNIRSADGVFNPIVLGTGKHTIICYYVVNATGCADTTMANITVEPIAAVKAGKDVIILAGQQTQLKPTILGGGSNTFSWYPTTGLSNPNAAYTVASPLVTTTYKLTVTSTNDGLACPVSDSLKVTVLQPPSVPNTFTPNGDSNNDTWHIKELDTYPGCTVEIFNRNGERVFYSVGYAIAWDGRYNGVNLPVGTYYYIIDPKNGRSKISGYVTIIR